MAEAALKYDFEQPETLMVPDGGLATFLTATEGAWADEEPFPQNGIAQVAHIADRLAEFGRHEDEYMVHAAEGETVIPMNVLDANPRLRKNLFAQMEKMGLEPERYVVGSELNSINPVTGQPEFFLKKLFKGVKKLVKKVVKVVKKALPIVLPIALSFTPLGPIWGAAMGSGIGTLAQGGSFRDALKSAVISGAIGGLTIGMKGGFKGMGAEGSGFGAGFKEAVGTAGGNVGERFGQFFGRPTGQPSGYWGRPGREILSPDQAATKAAAAAQTAQITPGKAGWQQLTGEQQANMMRHGNPYGPRIPEGTPFQQLTGEQQANMMRYGEKNPYGPSIGGPPATPLARGVSEAPLAQGVSETTSFIKPPSPDPEAAKGLWGKTKDFFSPGSREEALYNQTKEKMLAEGLSNADAVIEANKAVADMGMFAKYGPLTAAAGLGAAGMGFFSPPEEEDAAKTKEELEEELKVDSEKYAIQFPAPPQYQIGTVRVPGISPTLPPISMAAQGGRIGSGFPRRSGAIAGPGTGRSDDVPAMLSDGEFVFTAKAVRGAGNGSRKDGMSNMYQLMKNFEGAA